MSVQPARFTFDLDLADSPASASFMSDAMVTLMRQQARSEGFSEGFLAGENGATAATAQALAAAADTLADRAAAMLAGLDASRSEAKRAAATLAVTIARKLAAHLVATQPTAELEALLVDCLASLDGAPHLVIRCHPDLAEQMRERAMARIAASGFAGRLIVMGEPEIPPGDGRIEWADGGLVRDETKIIADIDQRIAAYLAALTKAEGIAP